MKASDVTRLLRFAGVGVTLQKTGEESGEEGTYNPDTSQIEYEDPDPGYVPTVITGRAAFINYSEYARAGGLVESTDKKAVLQLDEEDEDPEPGDIITDGVTSYSIISVQEIKKNDAILAYICQVKV